MYLSCILFIFIYIHWFLLKCGDIFTPKSTKAVLLFNCPINHVLCIDCQTNWQQQYLETKLYLRLLTNFKMLQRASGKLQKGSLRQDLMTCPHDDSAYQPASLSELIRLPAHVTCLHISENVEANFQINIIWMNWQHIWNLNYCSFKKLNKGSG